MHRVRQVSAARPASGAGRERPVENHHHRPGAGTQSSRVRRAVAGPSGDTLRAWLGVDTETFYDTTKFALVPMGFCYPGAGKSGDLPPRSECAPLWHERLLAGMKDVKLIILIGQYAQARYLGEKAGATLTETVRHWREHLPRFLPLPHPSPRNRIWLKRNPWFETEVIPDLRTRVARILRQNRKTQSPL